MSRFWTWETGNSALKFTPLFREEIFSAAKSAGARGNRMHIKQERRDSKRFNLISHLIPTHPHIHSYMVLVPTDAFYLFWSFYTSVLVEKKGRQLFSFVLFNRWSVKNNTKTTNQTHFWWHHTITEWSLLWTTEDIWVPKLESWGVVNCELPSLKYSSV